ncbi:hypothetical protein PI124_g8711 [Phytophthora idaei]|nr:hypothetical protein PI125_g10624 [Phytophthora idaei]KAG3153631.1 hypothetical protein PI126_g9993 [Phytophthora idaei]KAG3246580.1 hypothetical protein PI124_g8711 [Phytophthora idaei]
MLVQASPVCRTERQQSHLKGTSSQSTMNHVVQHELVLCRMVLRLWHVESVAAGGQASHGSSVFELFDMIAVN